MRRTRSIFFLGDNGTDAPLGGPHEVACAAPLRGKKGAHYEGGMRVPFIAAWAKANPDNPHQKRLPIAAGAIQSQLAAVYDLFPTVLGLTGVRSPAGSRRRRLAARRAADRQAGQDARGGLPDALSALAAPQQLLHLLPQRGLEGHLPLLPPFPKASEDSHYQLYNLAKDPFESKNLAPAQPEQLRRMMQGLIASMERHDAQYPVAKDGMTPVKPGCRDARTAAGSGYRIHPARLTKGPTAL